MFCPVCGNLMEDNTKFCGNCGTKIDNNIMPNSGNNDNAVVDDFLKAMEGQQTTTIEENTEAVFQDTKERLFLDDEDDCIIEDEEIVEKFFNNLETLEEDTPMDLSKEYNPEQTYTPQIAPVFEEIPDFEPQGTLNANVDTEEDNFNKDSDDDYSNIIMGDLAASIPQQFIPDQPSQQPMKNPIVEETIPQQDNASYIPQEETSVAPILQNSNVSEATNNLTEQSTEEPHILIDECPNCEHTPEMSQYVGYDININADRPMASQTPYLDSFLQHPNVNVDFEQPALQFDQDNGVAQQNFNATQELPPQQVPHQGLDHQQMPMSTMPPVPPVHPMHPTMPMQNQKPMPEQEMPSQQLQQIPAEATTGETNKPKKKKTGLIIGLSIAGILLVGLIIAGILLGGQLLNAFKDKVDDGIMDVPTITTPVEDNETTETRPIETEPTTPEDTTSPTEPEATVPTQSNNPNWDIVEESSIENPLLTGKATNIARYLDDTKTYELLQMKVTNFYRGSDAERIANEYEERTSIRFEKPQEDLSEYVVVEYQVYVPNDVRTSNTTVNLPMEVRGKESTGVVFNNTPYVIFNWCIETGGTTGAGNIVTCREIFQMPIGCTEYYLVFGTQGESVAIYRGE